MRTPSIEELRDAMDLTDQEAAAILLIWDSVAEEDDFTLTLRAVAPLFEHVAPPFFAAFPWRRRAAAMRATDEICRTHGVLSIVLEEDDHQGASDILFLNTGDIYTATLAHDPETDCLYITTEDALREQFNGEE